jgi:hypothetical protein
VSDDLTALLGRITAWLDDDSGGSNDQYEQSYALLSEAAAALASERQAREKAEQERDRLREAFDETITMLCENCGPTARKGRQFWCATCTAAGHGSPASRSSPNMGAGEGADRSCTQRYWSTLT